LVVAGTGFKVPFAKRQDVVQGFREVMERLVLDSSPLLELALAARQRVEAHYTWSAKAAQVKQVYQWVLGQNSVKPAFFAV
jgi:glycosyltransferase involved in cell wall biosynthesis